MSPHNRSKSMSWGRIEFPLADFTSLRSPFGSPSDTFSKAYPNHPGPSHPAANVRRGEDQLHLAVSCRKRRKYCRQCAASPNGYLYYALQRG